jgi:hypothetical protein
VGLKILILYRLVGAGMTLSQGWAQVATAIGNSAEPARTGFDLAAAAVMFLAVCWMSPKLSSAILGGTTALTGGDLAGVGVGLGVATASIGMSAAALAGSSTGALGRVQSAAAASSAPPNGRGPFGGGSSGPSGDISTSRPRPSGSGASGGVPSGFVQPSPPSGAGGITKNQQPSPPSLPRSIATLAERAFAAAEQTGGATRSVLRSLRMPHDGGGHAPPTIPTGHGED